MRKTLRFALAATLIAAATLVAARADDATIPAVGQSAPTFTLPSEDGSPISLAQYKGKNWVVLYFYPKDMSQGCTIEAHNFENALPELNAKKAVVVGVSVDTVDSHKEFCAKDSLTFHLLSDADHKVVSQYGSAATRNGNVMAARNTFLIDPKGNIVKEWIGVNPATAASDVLAALP